MSRRVLVVDFSAVFWRQWHASASEAVNFAADRTLAQIREHAARHDVTVVALDSPDCWRRDLWPQYKANRPPKDELALEQMRVAQAKVAEHYLCVASPRCEADDVIAGIVGRLAFDDIATILSADKDLVQLLDEGIVGNRPRCRMHHLGRGAELTYQEACAHLGAPVYAVAQWLTLVGDKSDGIPGVDGVGPKRAFDLLTKYGSIDGIFRALDEHPDEFTDRQRLALADAQSRPDCPLSMSTRLIDLTEGSKFVSLPRDLLQQAANYKPATKETTVTIETIETEAEVVETTTNDDTLIARLEASVNDAINRPKSAPRPVTALSFERALEPQDSRSAYGLAKVVVASRMFSAYGTPEAAMLVMMAGREFGLGAMASLRSFHIVEGKPTMSAQAMMARCLEHPSCKLFRVVRSKCSHEVAVVEVQRNGWESPEVYTWTIDDAKRAGLASKQNWSKYPRDMLINRCIAEAARFAFPEVMAGVYSPEEF